MIPLHSLSFSLESREWMGAAGAEISSQPSLFSLTARCEGDELHSGCVCMRDGLLQGTTLRAVWGRARALARCKRLWRRPDVSGLSRDKNDRGRTLREGRGRKAGNMKSLAAVSGAVVSFSKCAGNTENAWLASVSISTSVERVPVGESHSMSERTSNPHPT